MHLVELGVADAGRELLDDDLCRPRIGQVDLPDLEGGLFLGADDDAGGRAHGMILDGMWFDRVWGGSVGDGKRLGTRTD